MRDFNVSTLLPQGEINKKYSSESEEKYYQAFDFEIFLNYMQCRILPGLIAECLGLHLFVSGNNRSHGVDFTLGCKVTGVGGRGWGSVGDGMLYSW